MKLPSLARGHPSAERGATRRVRSEATAVWATAGSGLACVAAGVLLVVVPPDRPHDVGLVPAVVVTQVGVAGGASDAATPTAAGGAGTGTAAQAGAVPVAIELPGRGVGAPVVPTATGPDGALAVPDPPSTIGWWSPGALAGAASGTTVLVGHVDSAASGLGVFAVLRDVAVGERVQLRGADGRLLSYRVTGRRQAGKAALPADLFAPGGPPRLALVTCGGRFDRAARHYTDNVVVYAVPD